MKYDIPNNALIILVGAPGSGKSTIASKLTDDSYALVSSDSIREELFNDVNNMANNKEVFEEYHRRIEERLCNSKFTIADATSLRANARRKLYDIALKYNTPIRVVVMNISLDETLKQNKNRDRQVPDEVIIKMFDTLNDEYLSIDDEIKEFTDAKACDVVKTYVRR